MTAGACQKSTGTFDGKEATRRDKDRLSSVRSSLKGGSAVRIMLHLVLRATEKQIVSKQFRFVYALQGFVPKFFAQRISAGKKEVIKWHVVRSRYLLRIANEIISKLSQLFFVELQEPSAKIRGCVLRKFLPSVAPEINRKWRVLVCPGDVIVEIAFDVRADRDVD